jgi:hypothetical protein
MISKEVKEKALYFDVETATCTPTLEKLQEENPRLAELWLKRANFYRNSYKELSEFDDSMIFLEKAALEAEFSRVVCVSFGSFNEDGTIRAMSFYGKDEIDILNKTNKILNNAHIKGWKLCGHNIKGFDISCLGKRMLYNGIIPSQNIQIWDKKPWEIPLLDTAEIFSFGNWANQKYLGLDLLACSLGIKSPKDEIKGSDVSRVFWNDENYEIIKEYCERDVETVMLILGKVAV